jgi:flagellar protein FliS
MNVTSKSKLVEMMYEGILRFLAQAKKSAQIDDIEKKVYWINRAIAIYGEFIAILDYDKGGEVSHYLNGLYAHQIKILSESIAFSGDTKQDGIDIIDKSINITKELLEAWSDVS